MQKDIMFDNIYIGHSIEDAAKLKAETFDIKHPIEVAEDEATKPPPPEKPKSPFDLKFMDDPVLYVKEKVQLFLTIAKRDPIEAIKFVPEVSGGLAVLAVTLVAVIVGAISLGSSSAVQDQAKKASDKVKDASAKVADKAKDTKDQVVDAAASGADKVQSEINKRTTRSSTAAAE
jgi:calnexin